MTISSHIWKYHYYPDFTDQEAEIRVKKNPFKDTDGVWNTLQQHPPHPAPGQLSALTPFLVQWDGPFFMPSFFFAAGGAEGQSLDSAIFRVTCNSPKNNAYLSSAPTGHRWNHSLCSPNAQKFLFCLNICKTYGRLAKYVNAKLTGCALIGTCSFPLNGTIAFFFLFLRFWQQIGKNPLCIQILSLLNLIHLRT